MTPFIAGQRVRIKTKSEFGKEFGNGSLKCDDWYGIQFGFNRFMTKFHKAKGTLLAVIDLDSNNGTQKITLQFDNKKLNKDGKAWTFSSDMIISIENAFIKKQSDYFAGISNDLIEW